MEAALIYLLALIIGIVAGLRAMLAPATVAWMAHRGSLQLGVSWLAFLGYRWTPWVLTVAAVGELVTDQLPSTPNRKVPPQFGARLIMGAAGGAAVAMLNSSWEIGLALGLFGAVIGTLGGAAARSRMGADLFGRDRPAALVEDAVAIALAVAAAASVS